jgi:Major capsid protein Gp23
MGALLESGLVGNIGLKHLKVIKEDTINKWDKLGFLEGLKGHLKENVAQLYENQASYLINEATSDGSSNGAFETVVFPIVRRVFSKLLANDIVSVQAMNLPIGKLFYFVPRIQGYQNAGSVADPATGGIHYPPIGSPEAVAAGQDNPNQGYPPVGPYSYQKDLYDLFYEGNEAALDPPGLFDYSKGKWTAVTANATIQTWVAGDLVNAGIASGPVAIPAGNIRKVIVKLDGFANAGAGKLIGPDGNEMDTEAFLSDLKIYGTSAISADTAPCSVLTGTSAGQTVFVPLLFRVVTQVYGKGIVQYGSNSQTVFANTYPANGTNVGNGGSYNDVCDSNGKIFLEVDLSCPVCADCDATSLDGYTGTTIFSAASASSFTAIYRRYANLEFEDQIGEVSFDLESVTVSVTERKLRAQWSPELAQDVAAFHNIDAEAELTALLSEQVAAEIDREILRDLRKGAAWNLRWDYNGWRRIAQTTSYTQKDWNQTLITAINQLSAQIHKSTLRGGANWIVVSSEVSAIFDDLEYFHVSNAAPEQDQYNMGIERVGTLSGRYQVYRDPYFPPNQVLIGHKGTSLLDTGYIYAPYVPLQLTPTMYNPFNFTPIKGIMTRYAKKMVNNRFYGRITVDGVRTFDLRELR